MVLSRKGQGHCVFLDGLEEAVWLADMDHRKMCLSGDVDTKVRRGKVPFKSNLNLMLW